MKKEKVLLIVLPIILLILVLLSYFKISCLNTDAMKFKREYEKYNNKKIDSGKEYLNLNIKSNNPIKYKSADDLIDIISNKTGIIYLGFPECPWCRNAISVLLDVSEENDIKDIYYFNIKNERDSYTLEDSKLVYEKDENGNEIKGTKDYSKLLKALDSVLFDYVLEIDGKKYETGVKRIYAPSVIFIKDGKIIGIQVSTVESQTDPYKKLTKDQYNELYDIYTDYVVKMKSSTCSIDKSC